MSVFAIGDPHLSFSVDKPMDIFRGWDDYVTRLEYNWNRVVEPEDTVISPGDISWAMSLEEAAPDFEFLNSLNGRKYILKGNHDYWWNTMTKMQAFLTSRGFDTVDIIHNNAFLVEGRAVAGTRGWFYDDKSDDDKKVILREAGRLRASLTAAKELSDDVVVFLHYPPVSASQRCDELMDVLTEFGITECYFGHLHGFVAPENSHLEVDGIRFTLVSADRLEFCPKFIYKGE